MERCPALKLPKSVTFVVGLGHPDTGFNMFPDCVSRENLALEVAPTALVLVEGGSASAKEVVAQVARIYPVRSS